MQNNEEDQNIIELSNLVVDLAQALPVIKALLSGKPSAWREVWALCPNNSEIKTRTQKLEQKLDGILWVMWLEQPQADEDAKLVLFHMDSVFWNTMAICYKSSVVDKPRLHILKPHKTD